MIFELSCVDDTILPARCRAAVILNPSGDAEIALLELPDNRGRSVTNSWPRIAGWVLANVLPAYQIEEVTWYEVYPDRWRGQENVSRVIIKNESHRFEYEQDPTVRRRIWEALDLHKEELDRKFIDWSER